MQGFRSSRNLEKIGMKKQDRSELFFEVVRVPPSILLGGDQGRGFYQMMLELAYEQTAIGMIALGSGKFAISETCDSPTNDACLESH